MIKNILKKRSFFALGQSRKARKVEKRWDAGVKERPWKLLLRLAAHALQLRTCRRRPTASLRAGTP